MKYVILALFYAIALPGAQAYAPICQDECMISHQASHDLADRFNEATFQLAQVQQSQPLAIGASPVQTINGGTLLSEVINWLAVAFGTVLAGLGTLLVIKVRAYFGILTTDAQKAALQEIAVNAVNSAAAKAEQAVKDNPNLQINVKSAVAQDAVSYVQAHGADIIKSLGLDPNSGDAVDAIRARVATAMNSPETPTIIDNKVVNPGVETKAVKS
jgi:hypothetical protein